MSKNMRMPDREWSKNMWARIAALIDGVGQAAESAGQAAASAIKAITFNGGNVPPDATGRVTFAESDPTVPAWAKQANPPAETDPTVPAWAKAATKPTYTAAEVGAISTAARGAANGVASLDSTGKVPSNQLPSASVDLSQATGTLAIDHGGTGGTTASQARRFLGAASALWYYSGIESTATDLKLRLLDDIGSENWPALIEIAGDIMRILTDYKVLSRFEGWIKYIGADSGNYTFVYDGMLFISATNIKRIYGISVFQPASPDDIVTATVYQLTGTAIT